MYKPSAISQRMTERAENSLKVCWYINILMSGISVISIIIAMETWTVALCLSSKSKVTKFYFAAEKEETESCQLKSKIYTERATSYL